jgi:hypothetical protein
MIRSIFIWALWLLMAFACLYYAAQALPYITAPIADLRLKPDSAGEELGLRLHAGGGLVALVLGPLQFLAFIRRRLHFVHRLIGYAYILSVAIGVAGALVLARTPGGVAANAFAFNMLAFLWAASTSMALINARAKRWSEHQAWMVRSFALTFAAVTLRAGMPVLGWLGFPPSEFYTIVAWASWTINLIVVEWFLLPWLAHSALPVGRAAV